MLRKVLKGCTALFTMVVALLVVAPVVFASEATAAGTGESYVTVLFAVGTMIAAGLSIGLGAIGAGAGIGNATNGACQAVGRNPGVQGKVMTVMLIGMAMAESVVIYALVISFILLYANPFASLFIG
jgi:F-type H+-transporting ATPase subunit c